MVEDAIQVLCITLQWELWLWRRSKRDGVFMSAKSGYCCSCSFNQLCIVHKLLKSYENKFFCAIVLYLVVHHVCFQDGKLCLLVANDKLDGK
jgi:hypothetical protein